MTFLAMVVPLAIFFALVVSAWYVEGRLRALCGFAQGRRLGRSLRSLAIVALLLAIGLTSTSAHPVAGAVYLVGGFLLTVYLYLLLALLSLHAVQRFWRPAGSSAGAVLALVLACGATGFGAWQASSFLVDEQVIRLPGIARETTVMLISDVHLGHHRKGDYLARIVEETNRRRPDLILIAGDLLDSNAALQPGVLDPLASFAAPVYFVGGNHEKTIDAARALELIAGHGVTILHNERVLAQGLQLVGLDYMKPDEDTFDMHPSYDRRTIKDVLANMSLDRAVPSLLMHHSPVGVGYAEKAGIDLMVAGHTHGGQFFPGTLVNAWIFAFNEGLYRQGAMQIFVSPGAGTFMQKIRLGSSNTIHLLRLTPETR